MPFVLDNSVAMDWCFEDESSEYGERVLATLEIDRAYVSPVWPLEAANALIIADRRGRLAPGRLPAVVSFLQTLDVTVEQVALDRALGATSELATAYGLSAYDASYLELAIRLGLPLATLDGRLRRAATQAGIAIFEP